MQPLHDLEAPISRLRQPFHLHRLHLGVAVWLHSLWDRHGLVKAPELA